MQLDRERPTGNFIRGVSEGRVLVGSRAFEGPLIVTIEHVISPWLTPGPAAITLEDLRPALELAPEVLLLGTGPGQIFPTPSLTTAVLRLGVGLEVMNTPAACRTFNVLASEQRRVAALLFTA